VDDLARAELLIDRTARIANELGEPDAEAVLHELRSVAFQMRGDVEGLRFEAAAHESFGAAEGIPSVSALAAPLWLAAGEPERAARLVEQLAPGGFADIPRD